MAGLVVLDAGVLIALFDEKDVHHKWAREVFVATCHLKLLMSSLTYAEVLVHPTRAGRAEVFEKSIAGLKLDIHPVTANDSRLIARVRATTSLKMPDAVVLHLAQSAGATLATTDLGLVTVGREMALEILSPG